MWLFWNPLKVTEATTCLDVKSDKQGIQKTQHIRPKIEQIDPYQKPDVTSCALQYKGIMHQIWHV